MARQKTATSGQPNGSFREVEQNQGGVARISGGDDREVVHLLKIPPPAGGATCTCHICGLVFQSRAATWVTNARQHQDSSYHGKYKSCRRQAP